MRRRGNLMTFYRSSATKSRFNFAPRRAGAGEQAEQQLTGREECVARPGVDRAPGLPNPACHERYPCARPRSRLEAPMGNRRAARSDAGADDDHASAYAFRIARQPALRLGLRGRGVRVAVRLRGSPSLHSAAAADQRIGFADLRQQHTGEDCPGIARCASTTPSARGSAALNLDNASQASPGHPRPLRAGPPQAAAAPAAPGSGAASPW
jgi:hypothetical protein